MCHNPNYDLEAFEKKLDEHLLKEFEMPTESDAVLLKPVLDALTSMDSIDSIGLTKLLSKHKLLKYRKNSYIIQCMYLLIERGVFEANHEDHIKNLLRIKRGKSHSGIMSITIFTSAYPSYTREDGTVKTQAFSCKFNCHYCPNEPGQPRSYLKGEPGVLRANRHNFDPCEQMWARLGALYAIGHKTLGSKLEVLILGGTWTSYPHQYREQFIRDTYYAANTFHDKAKRQKRSLAEEIQINKDSDCRIIGLTIELRPDSITKQEVHRLRSYGCTRVQMGVQHLHDDVLKGINRQCTTERFKKGLKILKDCCFKVDIHIMPNLPFSSPEKDRQMLLTQFLGQTREKEVTTTHEGNVYEQYYLNDEDVQADQWKIYPCETVPYTEIERWYREGSYVPYPKETLFDLLYETKKNVFPWIRCNRIIRDIPKGYIIASSDDPNTSQLLIDCMRKNGDYCMCIRCRECKETSWDGTYITVIRHYKASGGDEYFISAESKDNLTLYGFLRLRLGTPNTDFFPELEGCGLIRELHVYGNLNPVGQNITQVQHKGIGKHLISMAECIAEGKLYYGMAIIAGVGVQRYYEKLGYYNDSEGKGDFMIKNFKIKEVCTV
jgi:histone acetyltransferase (RNA polymerase elongator complex component)